MVTLSWGDFSSICRQTSNILACSLWEGKRSTVTSFSQLEKMIIKTCEVRPTYFTFVNDRNLGRAQFNFRGHNNMFDLPLFHGYNYIQDL
jgi:hypothetical protein